jgi:Metal-dependent hydrolases of the beta-lactamase superfamily III
MIDRRDALKLALGSAAALAAPAVLAQMPAKPRTRVIFLGTKGGPRVGNGASNPANLVVVNDTPLVIDCGMGVSRQLVTAGVPIPSVKHIFITHHHSDHIRRYTQGLRSLVTIRTAYSQPASIISECYSNRKADQGLGCLVS